MSQETDNIALVKRYLNECWTDGCVSHATEYFSEDFIAHDSSQSEDIRGFEKAVSGCEQFLRAFPVINIHIENLFAAGDMVVVHWVHRGKHMGALFGVAPTHKEATLEGIALFRLVNGKIAETWEVVDALRLLQELGLPLQPERESVPAKSVR